MSYLLLQITSTKTRIKTPSTLEDKRRAKIIFRLHPLKQGLRRGHAAFPVADELFFRLHPLKQGLRLMLESSHCAFFMDFRLHPLKQGLRRHIGVLIKPDGVDLQITSTKTRIKTVCTAAFGNLQNIFRLHPLKQGLRRRLAEGLHFRDPASDYIHYFLFRLCSIYA